MRLPKQASYRYNAQVIGVLVNRVPARDAGFCDYYRTMTITLPAMAAFAEEASTVDTGYARPHNQPRPNRPIAHCHRYDRRAPGPKSRTRNDRSLTD